MTKIDTLIAAIIGEITSWYFIYLLGEPGVIEKLGSLGGLLWSLALIFPLLSMLGLWIADLLGRKFVSIFQLAKFLLVGVIATIFDLGILGIFISLSGVNGGIGYDFFKGASFIISTVLKYIPDKLWAFKKRGSASVSREFTQFFAVTLVGFLSMSVLLISLLMLSVRNLACQLNSGQILAVSAQF